MNQQQTNPPQHTPSKAAPTVVPPPPPDGTRQLVQWGGSIFATGLVSAILLLTCLGGFTPTGATTTPGWMALIVALMSLPFGSLLLLLGIAKWLRNRSLAKRQQDVRGTAIKR